MPSTEERKNCLFLFKILSATHPTYTACTWNKLKYISSKQRHKFQKNPKKFTVRAGGCSFFISELCRTPLSFPPEEKPPHNLQQHQSTKLSASSTDGLSTKSSSEVKFCSLTNEKYSTKAFQLSSTCFSGSLLLTYAQLRNL